MSKKQLTEPLPPHRILREVLRHYTEYREHVGNTGNHVIEHGYFIYPEQGEREKVLVSISFWDLHRGIKDLSPRKREALFYNVILDWKQRDVANKMGITTVSVGQYVEQAVMQLAKSYFAEEKESDVRKDPDPEASGDDQDPQLREVGKEKPLHTKKARNGQKAEAL